jgi:hypothetical protein
MAGDALEMATVKRALNGFNVVTQGLAFRPGSKSYLTEPLPPRIRKQATRNNIKAL